MLGGGGGGGHLRGRRQWWQRCLWLQQARLSALGARMSPSLEGEALTESFSGSAAAKTLFLVLFGSEP